VGGFKDAKDQVAASTVITRANKSALRERRDLSGKGVKRPEERKKVSRMPPCTRVSFKTDRKTRKATMPKKDRYMHRLYKRGKTSQEKKIAMGNGKARFLGSKV